MADLPLEETEILSIIYSLGSKGEQQISLKKIEENVRNFESSRTRDILSDLENENWVKIGTKSFSDYHGVQLTTKGRQYIQNGYKLSSSGSTIIKQEKCINAFESEVKNVVIGDSITIKDSFNLVLQKIDETDEIKKKEEVKALVLEIKEELAKESISKSKISICVGKIKQLGAGVVVGVLSAAIAAQFGI